MTSHISLLGLGTYKIKGDLCKQVVLEALSLGYKTIDTARCYKNEKEIGQAIKLSNIDRNALFITSKIAPNEHGEEVAYDAVKDSLINLQLTYLDCMLIHWPGASGRPPNSPENLGKYKVLQIQLCCPCLHTHIKLHYTHYCILYI